MDRKVYQKCSRCIMKNDPDGLYNILSEQTHVHRFKIEMYEMLQLAILDDQHEIIGVFQKLNLPTDFALNIMHNGSRLKMSPLYCAAIYDAPMCLKAFVDAGAILDRNVTNGNTALHGICDAELSRQDFAIEMVDTLLDAGANINAKNDKNNTPLHIAMMNGRDSIVIKLISRGADVYARNMHGCVPFHFARNSSPEVIAKFIDLGMNVDILDYSDETPLRYVTKAILRSVSDDEQEFTRLLENGKTLIRAGASIYLKNLDEKIPLDGLDEEEYTEFVNEHIEQIKRTRVLFIMAINRINVRLPQEIIRKITK